MGKTEPQDTSKTRLAILLILLVVIGAGCIYEFSYARPQFQEAWEKIKEVDSSSDSGERTSEDIREMMGRDPIKIDESLHDTCTVHTYRWTSGLLVKNHDIHVVFTQLNPGLLTERPELEGKLYYFSASAGQPLNSEKNFPLEKETLVINLNPPEIAFGGGGGAGMQRPRARQTDDDDKKEDSGSDEKADENADEKTGEEDGDNAAEEGGDDAAETKTDDANDGDKESTATETADDAKAGEEDKSTESTEENTDKKTGEDQSEKSESKKDDSEDKSESGDNDSR